MIKYYTGIGSRQCPNWAFEIATQLAFILDVDYNYILRSGGADGMDTAFEKGSLNKEIYLPWKGFNNNKSNLYEIDNRAFDLARKIHPNWNYLSQAAKKLHARNVYQIYGNDWKHKSRFVICWMLKENKKGGTLQTVHIANKAGIKVINLDEYNALPDYNVSTVKGKKEIIKSILDRVLIKRYKLKTKSGFYCKLFNNYRHDNECNEMKCEFCDEFYKLMEDPIINRRFGKLTVLTFYNKENNRPYYTCKCDCGNIKVIKKLDLLRGRIQSCGCLFDP